MSTAAAPQRRFDRDESQRRVKHPLQTLRKYIRVYVFLEGTAIALLFLAAWFWAGLLLDFGTFRLFAFDWLQELRDVAPDSNNAFVIRLVLLGVLLAVLAGLVITKVAMRWLREFNDKALALVLERRFPKELGDRLITAVELADPRATSKFGYSEAMIEHTIHDAVERVDRLPVANVFDWRRLTGWWLCVGAATVGMVILAAAATLGIGMATRDTVAAADLPWRMKDVGMIWTERNVLLQNSYWPRRAYLEIGRFQAKHNSPHEMRVPRDEARPELQVRAIEWVVADASATDGWRALRWADLGKFIDPALLARVDLPADWPSWIVDMDDLNPSVPNGLVPTSLHEKTSGEVRRIIDSDKTLVENLKLAGALDAVDELLNWKRWTVDKILLQEKRPEVRLPLRETAAHAGLEAVRDSLAEVAAAPSMSRTLRRLVVPGEVIARSRGETSVVSEPCIDQQYNKFSFDLGKLKETSRLRMQAEDYYTPTKLITLVAPPTVRGLSVDKLEPAYLYHRLQDGAQAPLKDRKQVFTNFSISVVGEVSTIDVPIGTDLVLRAQSDRKLREPVRMKAPGGKATGAIVPDNTVQLAEDGMGFQVEFTNIARTHDFVFEFNDEDNVRGRRHVRIRPVDDLPPRFEGDVGLNVVLRKPRARGAEARAVQGTAADGYLITPDALLPFLGQIRDDHGLTRVSWVFEVEAVDIELVGAGKDSKDKLPTLVLGGNAQLRRATLIGSAFQYHPANGVTRLALPGYVSWLERVLDADLSRSGSSQGETIVLMEEFKSLLQRKSVGEIPVTALDKGLVEPAKMLPAWEFSLRDEAGFDVRRQLPRLKVANPQKQGQLHYMLKVSVVATDNNVSVKSENGFKDALGRTFWGNSTRSKTPFQFLVVTENELLSQIAIEEESLYERLDSTLEKLKNAKTIADEQAAKLASSATKDEEINLVAIRLDEVRKTVIDAGGATRETYAAYANILNELKVNRVKKDRTEQVEDKIVWPLGQAVDPKDGNFVKTDDLYQKAYTEADDDAEGKRGLANRIKHQERLREAGKEMDALMDRIRGVVNAMNEGVVESKLIEGLVIMERSERKAAQILKAMMLQAELDVIKSISGEK
jgi:hypothetical protein